LHWFVVFETNVELGDKMKSQNIKSGLMVFSQGEGLQKKSNAKHIGTVDHLEGEKYIKLTKRDSLDGNHHWIPLEWVETIDEKGIFLNKTEYEVRAGMLDYFPGEGQDEQRRAV
jgi:hypothetical protein